MNEGFYTVAREFGLDVSGEELASFVILLQYRTNRKSVSDRRSSGGFSGELDLSCDRIVSAGVRSAVVRPPRSLRRAAVFGAAQDVGQPGETELADIASLHRSVYELRELPSSPVHTAARELGLRYIEGRGVERDQIPHGGEFK
jgi:hypothetical protein